MLYCCCFSLHVLTDNIEDFAPIIYTPTVGLVCQNYSGLFRRPQGMYFSAKDKGEMMSMIYNWPGHQGTTGVALAGLLGTGLITTESKGVDVAAAPFAKAPGEIEGLGLRVGANLIKVVKRVKPHVLLGLSGVGGVFNEQVGSPLSLLCPSLLSNEA
ncbi:hypothetical protein LOK49_LG02G01090 [Camellia lanceoleosa]|uniref:Uncharacterized protein n=1 Tax=Camellia lanceoleosa TaxID=1840588 RepID=A0ACC0IQE1_9ERIC|nr:hypothetical protein LOK49_LG02G01090 [Camellia lanceoleosa]